MSIVEELKKIIEGDIENSNEILEKYSHDASLFEVKPEVVIFPKNTQDVQKVITWVRTHKRELPNLSVTARCAGTCMSGGSINESIILDFTRHMNKLVSFGQETKITVQPGMFYRDFEKITLEKGTILPCYTASKDINAVGGMFGNNSAGEQTLQYGKTEEYILETKTIFEDGREYIVKPLTKKELTDKIEQNDFEGNIYKKVYTLIQENKEKIAKAKPAVTKNSAGYYLWNILNEKEENGNYFDLNKLLVGSQGTLGITTEITFKLIKPKKNTKLAVIFLKDLSILPELVNKILVYKPQTLESYDDKTFLLVLKYIIDFAKLLGLKNLFKLLFSFGPETKMTLRHGFPKLILLIEFTNDSIEELNFEVEKFLREFKKIDKIGVHVTKNEFEARKYWTIRHQAFNLIRYKLKKMKSKPFIDDVIVRPEFLPIFFPELYKILNQYKKDMTFAVGGHVGDGNMHIYTLLNPHNPNLEKIVMEVSDKVYTLTHSLKGSITAEHNDGIIRTPYLEEMFGKEICTLFLKTKEIFDPKYIFNPGKKVGGTKEYLRKHIIK